MKRISIVLAFLLCALAASAIGPRSPGGSGGGTFTGGTLSSDLIMGTNGTSIELASGSSVANLALRFRTDIDTGFYSPSNNEIACVSGGVPAWYTQAGWVRIPFYLSVTGPAFFANDLQESAGSRWNIRGGAVAASSTRATYAFGNEDTGFKTGLGRYAPGQPSMVASWSEAQRWTETGTSIYGDRVECVRVASSGTQIFQYTQLGEAAPKLKCKLVTGTLPSGAGNATVAHGLVVSKIVGLNVIVSPDGGWHQNWLSTATRQYDAYTDADNLYVAVGAGATSIFSAPFRCLIWYTE